MPTPADGDDGALEPARSQKWGEIVADQLRRQIIRGELVEGDVLPPETVLLERFGVSRPTMREAIRVLEAEGLVTVRRGSQGGVRVAIPRHDVAARYLGLVLEYRGVSLADVFAAVEALEASVAERLARTIDDAGLDQLRAALDDEAAADGPQNLLAAQTRFHRLLVDLTGDTVLPAMVGMLRHMVDTAVGRSLTSGVRSVGEEADATAGSRAHQRLVDLIAAGDADGAEKLWRRHLSATAAHVLGGGVADSALNLLG